MRKTTIKIKMLQTVVYALRPSFVLMKLFINIAKGTTDPRVEFILPK